MDRPWLGQVVQSLELLSPENVRIPISILNKIWLPQVVWNLPQPDAKIRATFANIVLKLVMEDNLDLTGFFNLKEAPCAHKKSEKMYILWSRSQPHLVLKSKWGLKRF